MIVKTSHEWPGIRRWLEEQIEAKRTALEVTECGIRESDFLRGELRFVRSMIQAVEPAALPEIAPSVSVPGAGF